MSLLDSDADELKNRGSTGGTSTSTGRKANQSGLGAFKGLSKYSSLTAKYRKPDSPAVAPLTPPVEQSRGTIRQAESQVSAESVQSQLKSAPTSTSNSTTNTPCEVSAKKLEILTKQNEDLLKTSQFGDALTLLPLSNLENGAQLPKVSADVFPKSVQSRCVVDDSEPGVSLNHNNIMAIESWNANVETQCKTALSYNSIDRASDISNASRELAEVTNIESKSVQRRTENWIDLEVWHLSQSGCEDSANVDTELTGSSLENSVQSTFKSAPTISAELEYSEAHPVQERTDLDQHEFASIKTEVQASAIVSANNKSLRAKPVQQDKSLGADSVQTPSEVSAQVSAIVGARVSAEVGAKLRNQNLGVLVPLVSILTISGSQRKILEFLFDQCIYNNSLITPPITKEQLILATLLKEETALSSIKRLRSKLLIDRVDYKDGKAGWTRYKLSEITYKELLNFRNSNSPFASEVSFQTSQSFSHHPRNTVQAGAIVSAIVGAKVSASPSSKIDRENFNLSQLTTAPTSAPTKPMGWFKSLDFTAVHPIAPMQVNSSIRNLVEMTLEEDKVQSFISRFKNWLATQSRVNNPLGMFCDKLKELANEGDSAVLQCMTEEERKIEIEFLNQLQAAKKDLEFIQVAKEDQEQKRIEQEFLNWYREVTDDELLEMLKPNQFLQFRSEMYKKGIRGLFFETVKKNDN